MDIPIYNAVKKYYESCPVPFHMPGHKLGNGLPEDFAKNLATFDLTEIPGTDNLHNPEGAIKRAQELAAEVFGADETFFLVNGSTSGIHTMIMAICNPGDKLIVTRDCHTSVINGMSLAGVEPIYVKPGFDKDFGISTVVLPSQIEAAIKENPDAVGVLITRPNYYGICADIEAIADIVHSYKKILVVDEAHGSHLKFSKNLPVSAMEGGADICVQSAHKTLNALTQGAYLHIKTSLVDADRVKYCLKMFQTTSPSYIIMVSLDLARFLMETEGEMLSENLLEMVKSFQEKINSDREIKFKLLNQDELRHGSLDFTRMVINTKLLGKTGYEVEKILRESYNIQVEMSDFYNIVCISSMWDRPEYFDKLYYALRELSIKFKGNGQLSDIYIRDLEIPPQKLSLKDVSVKKPVKMQLDKSVGKICFGCITPYPPGVPVVCPGEILLKDTVEYIYNIVNCGGVVNGLQADMQIYVVS